MTDSDLYELIGPGWRLPIFVKWAPNRVAEVRLADVPLLKLQRSEAEATLRTKATHSTHDRWFYSPVGLGQIAVKSGKDDPEDVVIWRRQESKVDPNDGFAAAYAQSQDSRVPNIMKMTLLWNHICQFMLEWMVLHEQPVEFGFGTMNAFCARVNWKNNIMGSLNARRQNLPDETDRETQRRMIRKMLHQSTITAWDEQARIMRWSVDFTPNKTFEAYAQFRELRRKKYASGTYEGSILRVIRNHQQKNRMYDALVAYSRETRFPYALLPHGGNFGGAVKGDESACGPLPKPHWIPAPVVAGKNLEDKSARALVPPDAKLLTVSDLEFISKDLWHLWGNVDTAGKDGAGAAGVRVLDAVESGNGRELLARGSHGIYDGMANPPELVPNEATATEE